MCGRRGKGGGDFGEAEVGEGGFDDISLANSMPVVRRLRLRMASRRMARMPQWKSRTGMPKKRRPIS